MCGLFGYQVVKHPRTTKGEESFLYFIEDMKTAMDSRGGDSWGQITSIAGKVDIIKGLGDIGDDWGETFFPLRDFVIGHTRYATVGAKTLPNAHPFQFGRIIGAHNGAIWNHEELAHSRRVHYDVDSMALIHSIEIGDTNKTMEGYGAVHWLDTESNEIRLCRMSGGELQARTVKSPDGGLMLVWASSFLMQQGMDSLYGVRTASLPELSEGKVYRVGSHANLDRTDMRIKLLDKVWSFSSKSYCGFGSPAKLASSFGEPTKADPVMLPASLTLLDYDMVVYPDSDEYQWAIEWLAKHGEYSDDYYQKDDDYSGCEEPAILSGKDSDTGIAVLFAPGHPEYDIVQTWNESDDWGVTFQDFRRQWLAFDAEESATSSQSGIDDETGAIMLPNWGK